MAERAQETLPVSRGIRLWTLEVTWERETRMENRKRRMRIAGGMVLVLLLGALLFTGALLTSLGSHKDLIPVGQDAPDFTGTTNEGRAVRLSDLRGRKRVVLVFYPGDDTPICTAQLCALRDNWSALQAENAAVYGVNPASSERHTGFAAKNRLPFPLLVDTKGEITARYGCRAVFGIVKRTVYVLDRQGKVAWVKRGNPAVSEILRALHDLKDNSVTKSASAGQ